MRTENLMVLVLSKNANCRVRIDGNRAIVFSKINDEEKSYDSSIAFNYISELRSGMFDIRSIVRKLNEIFGIDIDVKNEFCYFSYNADDVTCKLLISRGIKRYELIHK